MTSNDTSNMTLWSVLEKDKLNGTNFLDWFKNLKIVLKQEKKLYVLEGSISEEPASNASKNQKDAYSKHISDSVDVTCLMLATMSPELQKQLEEVEAYEMISHLKKMFQEQAQQESTTRKHENTDRIFRR